MVLNGSSHYCLVKEFRVRDFCRRCGSKNHTTEQHRLSLYLISGTFASGVRACWVWLLASMCGVTGLMRAARLSAISGGHCRTRWRAADLFDGGETANKGGGADAARPADGPQVLLYLWNTTGGSGHADLQHALAE